MAIIKDKNYKPTAGYVGACMDMDQQLVHVWERDSSGTRSMKSFPMPYYFYVPDAGGEFTSIFGDTLKKLEFKDRPEFDAARKKYKRRFESDFSALDRILMDHYYGAPIPKLNYAFIDIEVDYNPEEGFETARPENPLSPINAITIYKQWKNEYITIVVPPEGFTEKLPRKLSLEDIGSDVVTDLRVVANEVELLTETLKEIENTDVLSGWNSEFYDIPYLIKRTIATLGMNGARKWCFLGADDPKFGTVEQFGSEKVTASIYGRNHLDYLRLFKKFTFEGRSSYSLSAIAEEELDIPKLEYDGTLAELYNNDFLHFIKYNVRDVEILHRLDDKFKFINLANMMSHENTVLLDAVLGTVKYVETGLSNYAHRVLGKIVGDKRPAEETEKVEGAIVLTPKIGLHEWVGSVDINSLYPSVIRALNISPEKIIGQFVNGEDDWVGIRAKDDAMHFLTLEGGEEVGLTGAQWFEMLREQKWAVSAYGTVFDQSSGKGLIPTVLEDWYFGRKKLQAEKKKWTKIRKEIEDSGDTTSEKFIEAKTQEEYYDLLQLTRKIQLNSTYGALLNAFFRYFRMEMGASVTATGRQITTHMVQTISTFLTDNDPTNPDNILNKRYVSDVNTSGNGYSYSKTFDFYKDEESWQKFLRLPKRQDTVATMAVYGIKSKAIIYGDTDSCYYACDGASNKEEAIEIADLVASKVNESFPAFMIEAFNCQEPDFHDLIKAGREIVGIRGLFQAKKKYLIKVVDLEGVATDKLKTMGSEIKKADTPKPIQNFLKDVVELILNGQDYEKIENFVNEQRKKLFSKKAYHDIIQLGVARAANNLDAQYEEYKKYELTGKKKVRLPGHIRAAVMYNQQALEHEGNGAKLIQSGDKVKVFYLRGNHQNIKSIAFPADISKFPKWFDDNFKVDVPLTEQKMIDAKLEGIFDAWGQEVPTVQGQFIKTIIEF